MSGFVCGGAGSFPAPLFTLDFTEEIMRSNLILSRYSGQSIVIDHGRVVVTIVAVDRGKVRLSIEAPRDVTINRAEVETGIEVGGEGGGA